MHFNFTRRFKSILRSHKPLFPVQLHLFEIYTPSLETELSIRHIKAIEMEGTLRLARILLL